MGQEIKTKGMSEREKRPPVRKDTAESKKTQSLSKKFNKAVWAISDFNASGMSYKNQMKRKKELGR